MCQFGGEPYIGLGAVGDELSEADVIEVAERMTRRKTFAPQRHDRDAHPQRLDRRQAARIGKGIESDVDVVVASQQFRMSGPALEDNADGGNPLDRKELPDALASRR